MKRRKTEEVDGEVDGEVRGARPRPAPEESTMENEKDDPFTVFRIVCGKWADGSNLPRS